MKRCIIKVIINKGLDEDEIKVKIRKFRFSLRSLWLRKIMYKIGGFKLKLENNKNF